MGFKCGIVGLPNVGKSTLFNALTETAAAQAANYPFCTIEPNVGEVAVPDPRLDKLAEIAKSGQIIPTRLTFVDIAGLVRGASRGEGLGNQFLATIREVDAIAHVVRCFDDDNVIHVEGRVDPAGDVATIDTELGLKDLETLDKRIERAEKALKGPDAKSERLGLITFFTAGPKEVRAWTLRSGSRAPQAAGTIHTDFEKGFIKAEIIWWEDLVELGTDAACRAAAKLAVEGKEYVMRDGDTAHF